MRSLLYYLFVIFLISCSHYSHYTQININEIDVKDVDKHGNTPLHYLISYRKADTIAIIKKGANVNIKDKRGKTALHYVAVSTCKNFKKKINTINLLISNKANINERDNKGITPLHIFSVTSKSKIINYST